MTNTSLDTFLELLSQRFPEQKPQTSESIARIVARPAYVGTVVDEHKYIDVPNEPKEFEKKTPFFIYGIGMYTDKTTDLEYMQGFCVLNDEVFLVEYRRIIENDTHAGIELKIESRPESQTFYRTFMCPSHLFTNNRMQSFDAYHGNIYHNHKAQHIEFTQYIKTLDIFDVLSANASNSFYHAIQNTKRIVNTQVMEELNSMCTVIVN